MRVKPAEATAGLFLGLVAFTALRQAQRGTLGDWLAAKFLNQGEAPPTRVSGGGPRTVATPQQGTGLFADPLPSGNVISVWGDPRDGGSRRHHGVDIAAPRGTPVLAAAGGTVAYAKTFGTCGRGVGISHSGGWRTVYCHLQRILVAARDVVRVGQPIGTVGDSGNAAGTTPHLHFEARLHDQPVNPLPLLSR